LTIIIDGGNEIGSYQWIGEPREILGLLDFGDKVRPCV
jgi:hypothetical protein